MALADTAHRLVAVGARITERGGFMQPCVWFCRTGRRDRTGAFTTVRVPFRGVLRHGVEIRREDDDNRVYRFGEATLRVLSDVAIRAKDEVSVGGRRFIVKAVDAAEDGGGRRFASTLTLAASEA